MLVNDDSMLLGTGYVLGYLLLDGMGAIMHVFQDGSVSGFFDAAREHGCVTARQSFIVFLFLK